MELNSKIYVAGHTGLVGSALVQELKEQGYHNILVTRRTDTPRPVDLCDPVATKWFFSVYQPEYVFLCAARVGGIKDNAKNGLEFFLQNIDIERNVIMNAAEYGVKKLLFLGSSCMYPQVCKQPLLESYLMSGPIHPDTEPYALAKIAGMRMCQWLHDKGHNFITCLPPNLFGPHDNFNEETAHVIPGMMARMHRAKIKGQKVFKVWGHSSVQREVLYSGDLARILIILMQHYNEREPINVGNQQEFYMAELASMIAEVVGYEGQIKYDASQPVGVSRKVMDNSKLRGLGWGAWTELGTALRLTYEYFVRFYPGGK